MLNLMPYLKSLLPHPVQWVRDAAGEAGRECDTLSHPALQRMSLEELADLPFERGPCPAHPSPACAAAKRR